MKNQYLIQRMQPSFFFVLIIFLSLMGGGVHADIKADNNIILGAHKAVSVGDLHRLQVDESGAILETRGRVIRNERGLVVHLRSGEDKYYSDSPECGFTETLPRCQKYALISYVHSMRVFIVAKLYYEGAEYLFIDDNSGDESIFQRLPIFSPSGRHVVLALMNDEKVGFGIQIWHKVGSKYILEWFGSPYHQEGAYTEYRIIRWRSESEIELRSETQADVPENGISVHFYLRHDIKGWNVKRIFD